MNTWMVGGVILATLFFGARFNGEYQTGYRQFATEAIGDKTAFVSQCTSEQDGGLLERIGCECFYGIASSEINRAVERDRVPIAVYRSSFGIIPKDYVANFQKRELANLQRIAADPLEMMKRGFNGCD
jgi:hypothetical protein